MELRSLFITHDVNEVLTNDYEKIKNDYDVLYRCDTKVYDLIHFTGILDGIQIRPKKVEEFNSLTDLIDYMYNNNIIEVEK